MKPPDIAVDKLRMLEPASLRMAVPEKYRDENGHMNMRWYAAIFDQAGDTLHERLGLSREYHRQHGTGTFDLEHHTYFLSEVNPGDQLTVYARIVAHSPKRIQYLMFMVNETTGRLASLFECINSFADLRIRKTAAFPPEITRRIEAEIASSAKLDWSPPVCGVMRA